MNDNTDENRGLSEGGEPAPQFAAEPALEPAPEPALALDPDERLPWLESADDEDDESVVDTARLVRFVALGVALLALLVGGVWFVNHRNGTDAQLSEGAVIAAPTEPYKTEPADKGGKTFAGTGDSAFAVSEGKSPATKLAGADKPVAAPSPAASASPAAAAAETVAGVGVQVGAYTSKAAAEAGWSRLVSSHDVLKTAKHRVVEGSADIGTVYRLQAVTADVAAANALCSALKSAGAACQVKR